MSLDLNALLTAADDLNRDTPVSHGTRKTPNGTSPLVPSQTQYPCGLQADFLPWDKRDTVFDGGARDEMQITHETPQFPRAPFSQFETPQPGNGANTLSHLSHKKESEYPCGFPADFAGTNHRVPSCPACPITADDLEAREERAAIMEYDGGMTRVEAESAAGLGLGPPCTFPHAGTKRRGMPLACNAAT
jgi:hypothetical protein